MKPFKQRIFVALFFIAALSLPSMIAHARGSAQQVRSCFVVSVTDGDTLKARCSGKILRVRLAEIDAPEMDQPFGPQSKQSLSEICAMRQAELLVARKKDQYGRLIARVSCDGVDANAEQVRRGMAWWYRQHSRSAELRYLEFEARTSGQGLWSNPFSQEPPWEFR
ncbi:MAG: thermonuclease family protein, partial [Azoarcus sp.]|nr:thermonuclease family protein [Azoarcus sp.]